MNIKEIKETKNDLQKAANKGFGYFMKNIGMVFLMLLSIYIITNPTMVTNPSEFFDNFDINNLPIGKEDLNKLMEFINTQK